MVTRNVYQQRKFLAVGDTGLASFKRSRCLQIVVVMIKEDHQFRRRPAPTTPGPFTLSRPPRRRRLNVMACLSCGGPGPVHSTAPTPPVQSNCSMVSLLTHATRLRFYYDFGDLFLLGPHISLIFPYCYKNCSASVLWAVKSRLSGSPWSGVRDKSGRTAL